MASKVKCSTLDTRLRNPYVLGVDSDNREECWLLFLVSLRKQIRIENLQLLMDVHWMNLVCDCGNSKHGEVLKEVARILTKDNTQNKGSWGTFTYPYVLEATNLVDREIQEASERRIHQYQLVVSEKARDISDYESWKTFRRDYLNPMLRWQVPSGK